MAEDPEPMLTGAVLRAARALIEISAAELANESGVGERTILRAERDDGPVAMRAPNTRAIVQALGRRGVQLIDAADGSGPGLRLYRAPAAKI